MGIWIKTQKKLTLVNADTIKLDDKPNREGKYLIWSPAISYGIGVPGAIHVYGEYSTKEQVLEVMAEIEERINEGCPFVYQMPEDNNIEEE